MPRAKSQPVRMKGKTPRTYTEKQKRQALELYGTMSVAKLSKKLGIPKSTLGMWAAKAGKKSARSAQVEAAVKARQADFAVRRQRLKEDLLSDAEKLRDRLWKPCLAYNFGGKDNTFAKEPLKEPGFRDKREICTGVGILVDKVEKLEKMDGYGEDLPAVDLWAKTMLGKS